MKNVMRSALIATALVSMAGAAQAQTNTNHYASSASINGNVTSFNANTPAQVAAAEAVLAIGQGLASPLGTRYTAQASAPGDSVAATDRVDVEFTLNGTVNKDCSFYAGNNAAARTINFGVIGVRTGNNENVNQAFEMVGPAVAAIQTLTAGCNANNVVEINKDSALGLVNATPGGYDSNEFQANIPYSVNASWTGVTTQAGPAAGSTQTLNVASTALNGSLAQGAWRSSMDININAPVVNKGLVAGSYTGKTTIVLRAI
jgi:hypothetical protein